jgi:uncharacterized protein
MGREFTETAEFEWDEAKRLGNLRKHGIDFPRAADALRRPHVEFSSDRGGEIRTLAICPDTGTILAVVYTMTSERCRIISARTASKHEQRAYRQIYG